MLLGYYVTTDFHGGRANGDEMVIGKAKRSLEDFLRGRTHAFIMKKKNQKRTDNQEDSKSKTELS